MFIFLLLALPLATVCVGAWSGPRFSIKKDVLHVLFGGLAGIIYSGCGALFVRAYRLAPYSFIANWGFFVLTRAVLPLAVLSVLFVLLSRGSLKDNLYSLPLYCNGFFMVFMPYQIIHNNDGFDFFLLFVYPLLTLCMLSLLWYSLTLLAREKKVVYVVAVPALLAALLMPSLLLALYFINRLLWLRIALGVLFGAVAIYAAVLTFSRKVED